jgi:hypothetical protein
MFFYELSINLKKEIQYVYKLYGQQKERLTFNIFLQILQVLHMVAATEKVNRNNILPIAKR